MNPLSAGAILPPMRLLTLVRHAKSSWDSPTASDFERPLNERGRRDAPLMAARAAASLPKASLLLTSPATRALSTAQLFATAWGYDMAALKSEPRIYEASRKTLLELVQQLEAGASHAVLFGHNPGISALAHTLANCPFDEVPTCAVVHLKLAIKSWREAAPGSGQLVHYLFPKDGLD